MSFQRHLRAFGASVILSALPLMSAWAEEAEAEGGGMPQIDVAFYPEQIFWLLASFLLLYALMSWVVIPSFAKTQDNRAKVIADEIDSARAANEGAKTAISETEKALGEAREKAQGRVTEMLAKVAEESNERMTAQEKELLRKVRRAEEDIAITREAALKEVQAVAADLAKAVVEEILDVKKQVKA